MIANFERAMPIILGFEGGFSDNPQDPGAATMEGITLATYEAYVGRTATVAELRALQPTRRAAIYRANFWQAVQGDQLPAGVDLICFDAAIQHGPWRAVKFLQAAAKVMVDGEIGPATIKAVLAAKPSDIVAAIGIDRTALYHAQPAFDTFGKGWMARLHGVTATANAWAAQAVA